MELLVNKLISSILQILLFAAIPFIWWAVSSRKQTSFWNWIGLKKIGEVKGKSLYVWTGAIIVGFLLLSLLILPLVSDTAASEFNGLGIAALPAALVYAFFNTALPEEIIFRGFLLKRCSAKLGFPIGNAIQSLVFGLMHGVMFFAITGALTALLIIIFTGAIGWFMGMINEKKANGSILPSWLIHGIANTFSAFMAMFLIL
ncbi:CPBP family intramembrane metalloprotease [Paenibacillus sp. MSJ-6]|uniref:CPBP family intramembrane metalloprotease n=1 Tax=Paenibacillus brevis TaxID=2841508 RepID=A0ABS6FL62_9BACL|nr:CPBP family intramembrane metalloprotease [Paenibacillus brevis]